MQKKFVFLFFIYIRDSVIFVQWFKCSLFFFLDSPDSYNEIIAPQMKLFCCGFLFLDCFKKIADALYFLAGSGLELYRRFIITYGLMVQLCVCACVAVL